MKNFFFAMLYILVVATFLVSILGVITYTANINQNAFALCELVICLYCAASVLMKSILVKRSKQSAEESNEVDSSKESDVEQSDSEKSEHQNDESNH